MAAGRMWSCRGVRAVQSSVLPRGRWAGAASSRASERECGGRKGGRLCPSACLRCRACSAACAHDKLLASRGRSRSHAHLCAHIAYRHDRADELSTMHVCMVAGSELHASAIVLSRLARSRSQASRRVSGQVDARAHCAKSSIQCLLYITKDPTTVNNRTDFVTFTCLYFATGRCSAELQLVLGSNW